MVLMQGLRSSIIAALAGVILALALSGAIAGVVSVVNPADPVIYLGVFLLMLIVTGAACYVPARRASMVDPNVTLRS
jgi:ABC-type antimicrobial peptide transport system permease subunit